MMGTVSFSGFKTSLNPDHPRSLLGQILFQHEGKFFAINVILPIKDAVAMGFDDLDAFNAAIVAGKWERQVVDEAL